MSPQQLDMIRTGVCFLWDGTVRGGGRMGQSVMEMVRGLSVRNPILKALKHFAPLAYGSALNKLNTSECVVK